MPLYGVRFSRVVPPSPNLVPILIYCHIRAFTSHLHLLLPILHPLLLPGFPPFLLPSSILLHLPPPPHSFLDPFRSFDGVPHARPHLFSLSLVAVRASHAFGGTGGLSEVRVVLCGDGASPWALHRRIRRARVFASSPPVPAPISIRSSRPPAHEAGMVSPPRPRIILLLISPPFAPPLPLVHLSLPAPSLPSSCYLTYFVLSSQRRTRTLPSSFLYFTLCR
ncbi:hypothetical protein C8J57DRAFT_1727477 [Mycena rebaudengoi]|nr:hypothetical protein C8J57DRAFT_1727477 [Mycena rebaudengoi]